MEWACYKLLCDRPDVLSRAMIERTLVLLDGRPGSAALQRALAGTPLPKPPGHRGPPEADMFQTCLDRATVRAITACVCDAAGQPGGASTPRGLKALAAAWREYADRPASA
jgi:hypothetical protein